MIQYRTISLRPPETSPREKRIIKWKLMQTPNLIGERDCKMIPEKTIRSLRRMRRRHASTRRKRIETMHNNAGETETFSVSQSMTGSRNHVDHKAHDDGSRRLTRQELRVEAELEYAVNELGLP